MNSEYNKDYITEINDEKNFSVFANNFFEVYLKNEKLLSRELSEEFGNVVIPFLNQTVITILERDNSFYLSKDKKNISKMTNPQLFGSTAEMAAKLFTPQEYWGAKCQIKELSNNIQEDILIKSERGKNIFNAIDQLANGDSDFDYWVDNKQSLIDIFYVIYREFKDSYTPIIEGKETKQFRHAVSESIDAIVYTGPVYEGSSIFRTYLQLVDNDDRPLFHVDITCLPESRDGIARERRLGIGDVHNNCIWKLSIGNEKIKIDIPKEKIPSANQPSKLELKKKEIETVFEIVLREMRKKITHYSSINNPKRLDFSLSNIFPLMNTESLFYLKELTCSDESSAEKIFDQQSEYQKQMIFQELLLMAQVDPYLTIIFLQDTGMDSIYFGRHLTKSEFLDLISSSRLDFTTIEDIDKLPKIVKKSREKYLELSHNSTNKNGLERFICAIGQIFGDEINKNNHDVHFNKGLEFLCTGIRDIKINNFNLEKLSLEEKIVISQLNIGGGTTETYLHKILCQKFPNNYSHKTKNDNEKFRRLLLKLKKNRTD